MSKKNIKILVVEDNSDDIFLIEKDLNKARSIEMKIKTADTMKAALEILKKDKFDVILSDLSLPDAEGADTFARLKDVAAQTPIILLTALDSETLALELVKKGAQDYIVKGQFTSEVLTRSIFYAIERKRLSDKQDELISQLKKALKEIKTLSGLLPICAKCKKVRDDKGYWHMVESYISSHADVEFTHSFCPECLKELFSEFVEEDDEKKKSKN